jgi:hypothetical protein
MLDINAIARFLFTSYDDCAGAKRGRASVHVADKFPEHGFFFTDSCEAIAIMQLRFLSESARIDKARLLLQNR